MLRSFAERTSCFVDETTLADDQGMYVAVKKLQEGKIIETEEREKILCVGDKKTATQSILDERLALLRDLVAQWDAAANGESTKFAVCQEMLAAHTLEDYRWVGVFKTTRPAVCNATAPFYDASLCQAAEAWFINFRSRDLFTETDGDGFKGRAAEGENQHAEQCLAEWLDGSPWFKQVTTNIGSTVEFPPCTIETEREVFPEPILKVGVLKYSMANNLVADAFRQCGAPFVAGISGSMPNYLVAAAGGPTKAGKTFNEALDLKEALLLMAMLELSGFHAVTGLTFAVNFYYGSLIVTPPFDSGDFVGPSDGQIRCHDKQTSCCTNATKVDGFYNHQTYLAMMQAWEETVGALWP